MAKKTAPAASAPVAAPVATPVADIKPAAPVKRTYLFQVVPLASLDWTADREMSRDGQTIEDLAANIRTQGIDTPVEVVKNGKRFTVVEGRRRCTAAKMVGVNEIPVNILSEDVDTQAAAFRANYMRLDLAPLEKVEQILAMRKTGKEAAKISEETGANVVTVNNLIRIGTKLTPAAKEYAKKNAVGMSKLLKAAGFDKEEEQIAAMAKPAKKEQAPESTPTFGEGGDKEVDHNALARAVKERCFAAVAWASDAQKERLASFFDMLTPRQQPHLAGLLEALASDSEIPGDASEPEQTAQPNLDA